MGLASKAKKSETGEKLQRWSLRIVTLVVALQNVSNRIKRLFGDPPYGFLPLAKYLQRRELCICLQ